MKNVIALDPGYGNTKVCVNGVTASIQSAVARPQSTGMATIGMKTASQILSIELEGQAFAIGPGAWHWGNMLTSRDYSALASPERKTLAFTTLAQLLEPGEYDFELMVIGLPVPLLKDETQSQAVLVVSRHTRDKNTSPRLLMRISLNRQLLIPRTCSSQFHYGGVNC